MDEEIDMDAIDAGEIELTEEDVEEVTVGEEAESIDARDWFTIEERGIAEWPANTVSIVTDSKIDIDMGKVFEDTEFEQQITIMADHFIVSHMDERITPEEGAELVLQMHGGFKEDEETGEAYMDESSVFVTTEDGEALGSVVKEEEADLEAILTRFEEEYL